MLLDVSLENVLVFVCMCDLLRMLDLAANKLSGFLPPSITDLSDLTYGLAVLIGSCCVGMKVSPCVVLHHVVVWFVLDLVSQPAGDLVLAACESVCDVFVPRCSQIAKSRLKQPRWPYPSWLWKSGQANVSTTAHSVTYCLLRCYDQSHVCVCVCVCAVRQLVTTGAQPAHWLGSCKCGHASEC